MPQVFRPHSIIHKSVLPNRSSARASGKGMGSMLLDGGAGGQASYDSIDQYLDTTKRLKVGAGLGGKLDKLSSHLTKPLAVKKKGNLAFSL
jgi:hypothetical protein